MQVHRFSFLAAILVLLSACAATDKSTAEITDPPPSHLVKLGNGESNWIITEGATRERAVMTFPEVRIKGNGWLVLHPFKDGKPVGEVYVGATYLKDGENRDVEIKVDTEPEPGEMFIVMLHLDVNENREFDFVFVDDRSVVDKAVFEGTTMIAHAFAAP